MGRRVSPTLIGAFVLGALGLGAGAVLILGGQHWFRHPVTCTMVFDGSVAGLSVGAPVRFRGVPLGTVSDIELRYRTPGIVVVSKIDPSRIQGLRAKLAPAEVNRIVEEGVQAGLRAQLQLESLITGQLYVGLDFYPDTPVRLTENAPGQCEIPTIPTELAQMQEGVKKLLAEAGQLPLKETLEAATRAANAIEKLAAAPEISRLLRSADGTMQETQALVRSLHAKLDPAVDSLQATLDHAQRTIDAVGQDVQRLTRDLDAQVGPLAVSVGATADSAQALMHDAQRTLAQLDAEIGPTIAAVRQAAEATRDAMKRAESGLDQASGLFDGHSPLGYQLSEALEELTRTARTFRGLSEDVERQPNLWLFGRGGSRSK